MVVHAAARADIAKNWRGVTERKRLLDSNVLGTAALLEACADIPVVFLSTLAVYGDAEGCHEGNACTATSPYAASKLAGEALVQAYAFKSGRPWHVLRLGCVVGARYHHGHIADFVRMGRAGQIEAQSNGYGHKSHVNVLDVASAVMACVRGDVVSGVFNVAGGSWSPRDTIRVMRADETTTWAVNKHGWVGDPMANASNAKLIAAGWRPSHTIEGGVRDALNSLGWP